MFPKITAERILEANQAGLKHRNTETHWSYYTPVLQTAYDLGWMGHQVGNAVVSGYRYGQAPVDGISYNYSEQRREFGLSLAALDGGKEIGSSIWFAEREVYHYSGLLSPKTGSDGEPLILLLGLYDLDRD